MANKKVSGLKNKKTVKRKKGQTQNLAVLDKAKEVIERRRKKSEDNVIDADYTIQEEPVVVALPEPEVSETSIVPLSAELPENIGERGIEVYNEPEPEEPEKEIPEVEVTPDAPDLELSPGKEPEDNVIDAEFTIHDKEPEVESEPQKYGYSQYEEPSGEGVKSKIGNYFRQRKSDRDAYYAEEGGYTGPSMDELDDLHEELNKRIERSDREISNIEASIDQCEREIERLKEERAELTRKMRSAGNDTSLRNALLEDIRMIDKDIAKNESEIRRFRDKREKLVGERNSHASEIKKLNKYPQKYRAAVTKGKRKERAELGSKIKRDFVKGADWVGKRGDNARGLGATGVKWNSDALAKPAKGAIEGLDKVVGHGVGSGGRRITDVVGVKSGGIPMATVAPPVRTDQFSMTAFGEEGAARHLGRQFNPVKKVNSIRMPNVSAGFAGKKQSTEIYQQQPQQLPPGQEPVVQGQEMARKAKTTFGLLDRKKVGIGLQDTRKRGKTIKKNFSFKGIDNIKVGGIKDYSNMKIDFDVGKVARNINKKKSDNESIKKIGKSISMNSKVKTKFKLKKMKIKI